MKTTIIFILLAGIIFFGCSNTEEPVKEYNDVLITHLKNDAKNIDEFNNDDTIVIEVETKQPLSGATITIDIAFQKETNVIYFSDIKTETTNPELHKAFLANYTSLGSGTYIIKASVHWEGLTKIISKKIEVK